jgi:hypothetical protein
MRLRFPVAVVAVCALLLGVSTATAGTQTKLKLDSTVGVGHGKWLYSGRVVQCGGGAIRLIGVRSDGSEKELDWTLPSVPGLAWAVTGPRTGFEREYVGMRKNEKCAGDKIVVFQR